MSMPEFTCRNPSCKRARKEWALTCLECWQKVPQDLKDKLHEAGPRGSVQRGVAAHAAIHYLAGAQEELKL